MNSQSDIKTAWNALDQELEKWALQGKPATLWWRDDDMQFASPQLDRLVALSQTTRTPLIIAAIPHDIAPELQKLIKPTQHICVVQHGWCHKNHAPVSEKKHELGDHRPLPDIQKELSRGTEILGNLFGETYSSVLVPPWNRIGPQVKLHLADWGYKAVSTFGNTQPDGRTIHQVNTHVDLINWRGDRRFVGTVPALAAITTHLHNRRTGAIALRETTGILTHHLVHDEALWEFLGELFEFTNTASWQTGHQLFSD